ncbi:MAG: hypothetical protein ACP5LW_06220 [Nitrososphaeria archaeon]
MKEESFGDWLRTKENVKRLYEFALAAILPAWLTIVLSLFSLPVSFYPKLILIGAIITALALAFFLLIMYYDYKELKNPLPVPLMVKIARNPIDASTMEAVSNFFKGEERRGVQKFSEEKLLIPFEWILPHDELKMPSSSEDTEGMLQSAEEFQRVLDEIEEWIGEADRIRTSAGKKQVYVFYQGPLPLAFAFGNRLKNKRFFIAKWIDNGYTLLTKDGRPFYVDFNELQSIRPECDKYVKAEQIRFEDGEDPNTFNIYVQIGHHENLSNYPIFDVKFNGKKAQTGLLIMRRPVSGEGSQVLENIKLDEYVDYAVCVYKRITLFCGSQPRCDRINLFLNTPVEIAILLGYMLKPPPVIVLYHFVNKQVSEGRAESFYYSVLSFSKD